ncbi:polyhydroxyalkanoate synthesis repressor PhaR [Pelagibius sp. Alg239-R121]|uniref:polyhydroxyalkanoate synthesis repressor PhaR n=1 Tax=Pelagibius sp. Alg239-R121 TaxID=2993448 RepID=UPI0024A6E991|nr:polyhydroxyalkanoate synthesis repressor PhaR [Pelagibius sp. Alg239-R121]
MSAKKTNGENGPITIKKYANRRLYNTATSSYVTLDHLCQMVQEDIDFVVYDAKSGDDITRAVLTQIIVEEEAKGQNLLPINFLRQLIGFYGDNMQWMVPRYLEHMMEGFATNQEKLRQSMQETFGGIFPFGNLEEMGKQNMAMFENAMKLWTPPGAATPSDDEAAGETPQSKAEADVSAAESLDDLKTKVEELQKQLEVISKSEKPDK